MSTKLYDGLRLVDPGTSLFDVVATVSAAVKKTFASEADRIVAQEVARVVDDVARESGDSGSLSLFTTAGVHWAEQQRKLGHHSAFNDPLRFSIVFGKASSGRVLVYPFYSGDTYAGALEKTGLFTDYHYQNQSDQPEDVAVEEWRQRQEDWNAVLDEDGSFAGLPMWQLSRSIDAVFDYLDRAEIDVNRFVSPDERLHRILTNAVSAELMKASPPMIRAISAAESASRAYLSSEHGGAVTRPPLIPGLGTRTRDLGPVHRIPDEVLQLVVTRARAILDRG
ncbi:hypothetical protein [Streptomyces sp. NPDC052042]|uniref:hypothetical protein n=1 Tax=Streptomyces sp. NPDC052042 TaxID=3365683 RepID=UPI0037D926E8